MPEGATEGRRSTAESGGRRTARAEPQRRGRGQRREAEGGRAEAQRRMAKAWGQGQRRGGQRAAEKWGGTDLNVVKGGLAGTPPPNFFTYF